MPSRKSDPTNGQKVLSATDAGEFTAFVVAFGSDDVFCRSEPPINFGSRGGWGNWQAKE